MTDYLFQIVSKIFMIAQLVKEFFINIKEENLKYAINNTYKGRFDVKVENEFLELYHG